MPIDCSPCSWSSSVCSDDCSDVCSPYNSPCPPQHCLFARFSSFEKVGKECIEDELNISNIPIFQSLPFIEEDDACLQLTRALFSNRVPEDLVLNLDEDGLKEYEAKKAEVKAALDKKTTHKLLDKADKLRHQRVSCLYRGVRRCNSGFEDGENRPRLFSKSISCSRHYPSLQQSSCYEGCYIDCDVKFTTCSIAREGIIKDKRKEQREARDKYYIQKKDGLDMKRNHIIQILKGDTDISDSGDKKKDARRAFRCFVKFICQGCRFERASFLIQKSRCRDGIKEDAKVGEKNLINEIVTALGANKEGKITNALKGKNDDDDAKKKEIEQFFRWNCGANGVGADYIRFALWSLYGDADAGKLMDYLRARCPADLIKKK